MKSKAIWLAVLAVVSLIGTLAIACSSTEPAQTSDAVTKEELSAALQEAMQSAQTAPAPAPARLVPARRRWQR